jgi:hypothetical protein
VSTSIKKTRPRRKPNQPAPVDRQPHAGWYILHLLHIGRMMRVAPPPKLSLFQPFLGMSDPDAALAAAGGQRVVQHAVNVLWRRAGWMVTDMRRAYGHAERADRPAEGSRRRFVTDWAQQLEQDREQLQQARRAVDRAAEFVGGADEQYRRLAALDRMHAWVRRRKIASLLTCVRGWLLALKIPSRLLAVLETAFVWGSDRYVREGDSWRAIPKRDWNDQRAKGETFDYNAEHIKLEIAKRYDEIRKTPPSALPDRDLMDDAFGAMHQIDDDRFRARQRAQRLAPTKRTGPRRGDGGVDYPQTATDSRIASRNTPASRPMKRTRAASRG